MCEWCQVLISSGIDVKIVIATYITIEDTLAINCKLCDTLQISWFITEKSPVSNWIFARYSTFQGPMSAWLSELFLCNRRLRTFSRLSGCWLWEVNMYTSKITLPFLLALRKICHLFHHFFWEAESLHFENPICVI